MVKVIKVPKTPKSAYDPARKVSNLLKAHIVQLEAARQKQYGLMAIKRPRNEGQASAYIAELTQLVHPAKDEAAAAEAAALRPAVADAPVPVTDVKPSRQSPARPKTKPARRAAAA
ncbi:MAG: hypothetical protein ABJC89_26275, partial [Acidobacteriota bacterium]